MHLSTLRLACLSAFLLASTGNSDELPAVISPHADRSTFFPEETVTRGYELSGAEKGSRLSWRISADARSLARGTKRVVPNADLDAEVKLELRMPAIRDGVALPMQLQVTLTDASNQSLAEHAQPIWVLASDPFADNRTLLRERGIALYDPLGQTASLFADASIPFSQVATVSALQSNTYEVVVIGENANFGNPSSVFPFLIELASQGRRVVCLAPTDGAIRLPEQTSVAMKPTEFRLRQPDVIHEFDKRLDTEIWSAGASSVRSVLRLATQRDEVVLKVEPSEKERAGEYGWPWCEFNYPNGGKLTVCGFGIIESWSHSPTPRYLLLKLLTDQSDFENR